MAANLSVDQAAAYLRTLCQDIPGRAVGSPDNQEATAYVSLLLASFGFQVECPRFDCMDWHAQGAALHVGDRSFPVAPSPFTNGCLVRGSLAVASTLGELEGAQHAGKILLLVGDLAREQLMPKNFPFFHIEHHQRIIGLLEAQRPLAIVAATSCDPSMAGALYPFPLFEDGDFDIPSVYMTDVEGTRLRAHIGEQASLEIHAQRKSSEGCNVIARKGTSQDDRLVFFAHIDAKQGTPGALDNASGVTVLLLLADLLADYRGGPGIEIVALNGEDYYSNPGEQQWLALNAGKFDSIRLGINVDGAGYCHGKGAYSLYDCDPTLAETIRKTLTPCQGLVEGEAWYQGDHMLFLMNGRPALAITSERVGELMREIIHTGKDQMEIVDPARLVEVAGALRELVEALH